MVRAEGGAEAGRKREEARLKDRHIHLAFGRERQTLCRRLSGFIEPCHPTERGTPPSGGNWIHEIKADGYRAQVHVRNGKVTVYSRRGHDWSETFASITRAAESLPVRHAVLDGEAIVQDATGIADYHALRRELARKHAGNLTYYVFDLLYLEVRICGSGR